jgi:hypothetical protein
MSDERERVDVGEAEKVEDADFEGHRLDLGRMDDGQVDVGRLDDGKVDVGRLDDGKVDVG